MRPLEDVKSFFYTHIFVKSKNASKMSSRLNAY